MAMLAPPRSPNPLFRTSSASSVSSIDTQSSLDDVAGDGEAPRRTRKRFTSTQLMMLEHLYHQTSHPTREQREALAKEASIELRSVTVWFQNKRQTERKVQLQNSVSSIDDLISSGTTLPTGAQSEARSRRISNHIPRSPPLSASPSISSTSSGRTVRTHHLHHHRPQLSSSRRPSLDHVATRAERERPQHIPRTPPRIRTLSSPNDPRSIWENMPSSPPSPLSPAIDRDRDLIDFGLRRCRSKPTLEWACAAARVSGHRKDEEDMDIEEMMLDSNGGDTEDEMEDIPHEALTPNSSIGSQGTLWKGKRERSSNVRPVVPVDVEATPKPVIKTVLDQDVMEAALALCGLGGARR